MADQDTWDPRQYERFAAERRQPFDDLVSLVHPVPGGRVVDLGCGQGNLTAELASSLGAAEVLGIDSSPAMLRDAASHAGPRVRFEAGDIATWTAAPGFAVVLSNAALHWVPDHEAVLARWAAALMPGGQLAFQAPCNAGHPAHVLIDTIAHEEPFRSAMGGSPPPDAAAANTLAPRDYAELLFRLGFERQSVRLQVYGHVLDSTADIVEWVKGSTLTRFRPHLSAELYDELVERYRRRVLAELGDQRPCFYTFQRILCWGQR